MANGTSDTVATTFPTVAGSTASMRGSAASMKGRTASMRGTFTTAGVAFAAMNGTLALMNGAFAWVDAPSTLMKVVATHANVPFPCVHVLFAAATKELVVKLLVPPAATHPLAAPHAVLVSPPALAPSAPAAPSAFSAFNLLCPAFHSPSPATDKKATGPRSPGGLCSSGAAAKPSSVQALVPGLSLTGARAGRGAVGGHFSRPRVAARLERSTRPHRPERPQAGTV